MHLHVAARVALAEDVRALEAGEGRRVEAVDQRDARRGQLGGVGKVEFGGGVHGADCSPDAPPLAKNFNPVDEPATGLDRIACGGYIGDSRTTRQPPMTDDTQPTPSSVAPGWAFLAAAACLALSVTGIVLDERSTAAAVSQVGAALALPAWLAIGVHLATRSAPSRRARALLILAVIVVMLLTIVAIGALLFAHQRTAAWAFVGACVVAGICLERGS